MRIRTAIGALFLPSSIVIAAACGGSQQPPPTPPAGASSVSSGAPASSAAATVGPEAEPAHNLVILTSACWFGGVWSDAEGAQPDDRRLASEARCHSAVSKVWGTDDKTKYEQLRAFEATALDDVAGKVESLAKSDATDGPRKDNLIKVLRAVAAAKKEEMLARRAADKVKRDLGPDKEPEKLNADEAASAAPLKASAALGDLLKLDAGDLTSDAHALGVLSAMDRMEMARGLPKHLKVYAVGGAFQQLWGVNPPDMPEEATKKLKPGMWLAYLIDTAKAAAHPVPDTAKTPKDKEPLAWSGVLQGFADKLKADDDKISDKTPLNGVVLRVVHRLEAEFNAETNAAAVRAANPAASGSAAPAKAPPAKAAPKK